MEKHKTPQTSPNTAPQNTALQGGQPTFFCGSSVKTQDPMVELGLDELVRRIRTGADGLDRQVEALRRQMRLDPETAKRTKAGLPFFIGASFAPAVRRRENFLRIDYLVLDLDQVANHGPTNPRDLIKELAADERVLLAFVSPGGNGVKLVFQLRSPCFDPVAWRAFYQGFARDFADLHELGDMVDPVCHDVTRVCFLSHDPEALFRPHASSLDWESHLPNDEELLGLKFDEGARKQGQPKNTDRNQAGNKAKPKDQGPQQTPKGPDEDQLAAIKRRLNPNARIKKEKQCYLPPEVAMVEGLVEEKAKALGMALKETRPINYGKKFVFALGKKWCEINLFHGKKGYKAVITPKSGSDKELSEACLLLVENVVSGD